MRLVDADALEAKIPYLWSDPTDISMLLDLIDKAPTVPLPDFKEGYKQAIIDGKTNFSRPQGEWIMQRHDMDGCFYTCSNCGRMIRVSLFIDDPEDNETLADYPFCHCGAKMIGKEE